MLTIALVALLTEAGLLVPGRYAPRDLILPEWGGIVGAHIRLLVEVNQANQAGKADVEQGHRRADVFVFVHELVKLLRNRESAVAVAMFVLVDYQLRLLDYHLRLRLLRPHLALYNLNLNIFEN